MEKYIKVEYWKAQKYSDENWYDEYCFECMENSVVFVPEDLYNEYFKK